MIVDISLAVDEATISNFKIFIVSLSWEGGGIYSFIWTHAAGHLQKFAISDKTSDPGRFWLPQ